MPSTVTKAFGKSSGSSFMISTHITEVGEVLRDSNDNVQFVFMPTILFGNTPQYTYRLTKGISNDRQGMMIVENENIFEMLKS